MDFLDVNYHSELENNQNHLSKACLHQPASALWIPVHQSFLSRAAFDVTASFSILFTISTCFNKLILGIWNDILVMPDENF